MGDIERGRWTATPDEGVVAFLIGMRVNTWHKPWRWLPAAAAMPKMLAELARNPELGLLDARSYRSGRTFLVVQYWRSWEHLDRYARDREHKHLPAWRAFNRRSRGNHDVGVFHETYVTQPGGVESVYVNMPLFGLAKATTAARVESVGERAGHRLDPSIPDDAAVS